MRARGLAGWALVFWCGSVTAQNAGESRGGESRGGVWS